jgi:hypothetical protein
MVLETPEPTESVDSALQRQTGAADAKGQVSSAFAVVAVALSGVVRTCTREDRERFTAPSGVVYVFARQAELGLTRENSQAGTWRVVVA